MGHHTLLVSILKPILYTRSLLITNKHANIVGWKLYRQNLVEIQSLGLNYCLRGYFFLAVRWCGKSFCKCVAFYWSMSKAVGVKITRSWSSLSLYMLSQEQRTCLFANTQVSFFMFTKPQILCLGNGTTHNAKMFLLQFTLSS